VRFMMWAGGLCCFLLFGDGRIASDQTHNTPPTPPRPKPAPPNAPRRVLQQRALPEKVGLEEVVDLVGARRAVLVDDGLSLQYDVEKVPGVALDDDLWLMIDE
jgi:hypothetical protein